MLYNIFKTTTEIFISIRNPCGEGRNGDWLGCGVVQAVLMVIMFYFLFWIVISQLCHLCENSLKCKLTNSYAFLY